MELINENTTRKVDALGRVSLPKGMRNRLRLEANDELEFYTLRDNGKDYICCAKPSSPEEQRKTKLKNVVALLEELKLAVPDTVLAELDM